MRIRSIKPEFWRSDDISCLNIHDRLLFIGLWSYVDDNGVGIDSIKNIAFDLFGGDVLLDPNETLARLSLGLSELRKKGLICRYHVDGKKYLHVSNWAKHQRIVNPNKPRFPLPTEEDKHKSLLDPNETLARPLLDSSETLSIGTGEQGNRGTGEQGIKKESPKGDKKKDRPETFVAPTLEEVIEYSKEYFQIKGYINTGYDPETFFDHYQGNGWKVGKVPMKDWRATCRKWIRENAYKNGAAQVPSIGRELTKEEQEQAEFNKKWGIK